MTARSKPPASRCGPSPSAPALEQASLSWRAQALEVATWGAVLKAPRCVLAGDHLQLPPPSSATAPPARHAVTPGPAPPRLAVAAHCPHIKSRNASHVTVDPAGPIYLKAVDATCMSRRLWGCNMRCTRSLTPDQSVQTSHHAHLHGLPRRRQPAPPASHILEVHI